MKKLWRDRDGNVLASKPKPKWEGLHSKLVEVLKTKGALESAYTVTCEGKRLDWNGGRNPATLTIAKGCFCASFATENGETGHLSTPYLANILAYEDFWEVTLG